MAIRVLTGDCREVMNAMKAGSIDCIVTSPPYWGLRDYGVAGQLGMEPSLGEHIAVMVDVFEHVRRVLKPTGTLWLNYGDSYASGINGRSAADTKAIGNDDRTFRDKPFSTVGPIFRPGNPDKNGGNSNRDGLIVDRGSRLKPKDLCMVPNRLAIALQDAGWWVRSEIIWAKPNPMPESTRDRPTSSHEKLWLLAKSERYFYDADAIAEPGEESSAARYKSAFWKGKYAGVSYLPNGKSGNTVGMKPYTGMRNKRNVWTIPSLPFPDAHFATFPPALVEPCILAGCPKGGTVLDPFGGAGTTGLVADRLGRNAILIELNPAYAEMARERVINDAGMFAEVAAE